MVGGGYVVEFVECVLMVLCECVEWCNVVCDVW